MTRDEAKTICEERALSGEETTSDGVVNGGAV